METLELSIVTPNGQIFSEDIKEVILPGKDGEFGVLPGHSALISSLDVGVIEVTNTNGTIDAIAINWGYVKVNESSVDVLADGAVVISSSENSDVSKNINEAIELVNSIGESSATLASIKSKITSYKS